MAFTLKDGQGTLHKNDKGGVETRPDYRGELMLLGAVFEVAGWLKDGPKGKWMSLSVKTKAPPRQEPEVARGKPGDIESDIPF